MRAAARRWSAWFVAAWLVALGGPAAAQPSQACIETSVVDCFDGCLDPLNFQECLVGCAAGAFGGRAFCLEGCFNNPVCETNCLSANENIQACGLPSPKLTLTAGAVVFNRATGVWQQTVRVRNKTLAEAIGNIAVVATGPANGWNLANADNTTLVLGTGGPYRNLPGVLDPGASATLVLVYSRTGTLPFSLVPQAFSSVLR